jgi:hypothetical protein
VPPGSADLTLKIKDVDPQHLPKGLASMEDEPGAKLIGVEKKPHLKVKVHASPPDPFVRFSGVRDTVDAP